MNSWIWRILWNHTFNHVYQGSSWIKASFSHRSCNCPNSAMVVVKQKCWYESECLCLCWYMHIMWQCVYNLACLQICTCVTQCKYAHVWHNVWHNACMQQCVCEHACAVCAGEHVGRMKSLWLKHKPGLNQASSSFDSRFELEQSNALVLISCDKHIWRGWRTPKQAQNCMHVHTL